MKRKNAKWVEVKLVCPECGRNIEVLNGAEATCLGNMAGKKHQPKRMVVKNGADALF